MYKILIIDPNQYMADMNVVQLSRGPGSAPNVKNTSSPDVLRRYIVKGVFPTAVSQIDLSYDTSDTIEEYTVEFQVQYWTAGKGNAGNDQSRSLISW